MTKTIIILTILIVIFNLAYSQEVRTKEQTKIDYTNYCLEKFRREHMIGLGLQVAGIAVIGFTQWDSTNGTSKAEADFQSNYQRAGDSLEGKIMAQRGYEATLDKIEDKKRIGIIVGVSMGALGVVFQNINYRWLRRAYVGEDGIGVKIPLNK